MGAAAAAAVSKGSARKQGKKYLWGSERPGVLKRRVQIRMEQLPKKLEEVEERVARFRAAELARVEAERLFLEDQKALLNEHEELVRSKRFRPVSSYQVDLNGYPDAEVAAVRARNPDADEEAIFRILSRKSRPLSHAERGEDTGVEASEVRPQREVGKVVPHRDVTAAGYENIDDREQTEAGAKSVVPPTAKPAPVHIAASVTISPSSGGDEDGRAKGTDCSDFDPDKWIEGQDYPEDRYREITDRDGIRVLVARTDEEDLSEVEVSPEVQALWDRDEELSKEQDELMSQHGQIRMNWPQSARDRMKALSDQRIAISIQMEKVLEG